MPAARSLAIMKYLNLGSEFDSQPWCAEYALEHTSLSKWECTMSTGSTDEMTCIEVAESASGAMESSAGTSPYSTGGGGFTFERKVAVKYLAHLLVGDNAVEFGDGRRAVSVAFQQAPENPADDLVIRAARPDEPEPSLELEVEVRRSPNLVASDAEVRKLVRRFVRAVIDSRDDTMEHRLGLVVAGPQRHAEQLEVLAAHAAVQIDAPGFFNLIRTPQRFDSGVRQRLEHLEKLVERALNDLGVLESDTILVQQRTWELLSRLKVLMPRLETPDEADWPSVTNSLIDVARGSDLAGATELRNKLVALAAEYLPKAARIDLKLLRRDAHWELDSSVRRHQEGWQVLDSLHRSALQMATDEIVSGDGTRRLRLDRSDQANELIQIAEENAAAIVSGDSGVGKSALTIKTFNSLCSEHPQIAQVSCLNLRHVPKLTVDFEGRLGRPLSTLLSELSAPQRLLIVDGADAVAEGMEDVLRYLVDAAMASEVKVVAVAAADSKQVVSATLTDILGDDVAEYSVKPLTDGELDEVVETFPELEKLNANPRSREVLRRLVVIDLLIRGHLPGIPLNDADAMRDVWSGLVRRNERSDRGLPDARESALLRLAELTLSGGDRLSVVNSLDAAAVYGLRQDGLLRTSPDNPFMAGPDFAHDEVRRYAVARLLLTDSDPTSRILDSGAPRWALGVARLACEALLGLPNVAVSPIQGRFGTLQGSFDALVDAGHEARWADVPSEALLKLANPIPVLRDAWPMLLAGDSRGLRRIARLVDQRLRVDNGFVSLAGVESIVTLLLEDDAPWRLGKYASGLLRDWLHSHMLANTASGHSLRLLLRERLIEAGAQADRRLVEEREAEADARAARSSDDLEREQRISSIPSWMFTELGYGGRRRRQRPEVPREIRDEVFLELLALLGPDLGEEGEAILMRVATDAPWDLSPAVESQFAGHSIARYSPSLLAQLTEAYYLDDEANEYDSHGYGIRGHRVEWGGNAASLDSWHLGPFFALFQSDFRTGVAVLNRMLNHAANTRARVLARLHTADHFPEDLDISPYQADLEITGESRQYVGDSHVYLWYRGTGVGSYPCMSALQALEVECDRLIRGGAPIEALVSILLDGCENLAMVGLVVGILVRHLDVKGNILDPFLTEPLVWKHEFKRAASEWEPIAASSDGIEFPERREWSLHHAATLIALAADGQRGEQLRDLGDALIENAHKVIEQEQKADDPIALWRRDVKIDVTTVNGWAGSLNPDNVQIRNSPDGVYIESRPSETVVQGLQKDNEDLERVAEEIRLLARYFVNPRRTHPEITDGHELTADIAAAHKLLEVPPSLRVNHPWDVPSVVAAAALEAHLLRGVELSDDALAFACQTVLRVAEGEGSPRPYEYEDTYFEQGADRSAARVLPLLIMPSAESIRSKGEGADQLAVLERAYVAGFNLAQSVPNEVRLHLARGLDHLWETPCSDGGSCHHEVGLHIASETMRDCVIGDWDLNTGVRQVILLDEPLVKSLADTSGDSIITSRLDAAIRALAPAATADVCISNVARDLLNALLDAQRRSLLSGEEDGRDWRGTHSIVSARALWTLAQHGDDAAIFEHIGAYADNPSFLGTFLRALSAAAEETRGRAETAQRLWPAVIDYVVGLHRGGHAPFEEGLYGEMTLVGLLPNSASEYSYLYREIQDEPIAWWNPLDLRTHVEDWLTFATGKGLCVDQIILFLRVLSIEEQALLGIPWIRQLVLANPRDVANRSSILATWLIEMRSSAADAGLVAQWQQIVDALVVEGIRRLAPYSE